MEKALALNLLSNLKGSGWDIKAITEATKTLSGIASEDGLSNDELIIIANALNEEKLSSSIVTNLLRCLVPETQVSKEVILKVLSWIFTNIGNKNPSVERLCFRWFVDAVMTDSVTTLKTRDKVLYYFSALLQYNLCERDSLQMYYHDFFFAAIKHKHLEIPGVTILYYLSGKDDAKKWIIQPLIKQHKIESFSQLNALLRLLKSHRPDLIQESFPDKPLQLLHSSYDTAMKNVAMRVQHKDESLATIETIWNTSKPHTLIKKRPRLIPAVEYLNRVGHTDKTEKSIDEFKSIVELGKNQLQVSTPAQILATLSSENGFHFLAFAQPSVQVKFMKNLQETLYYAFLSSSGPYSSSEKTFLLVAIAALEEFLQQSISVVNKFLVKYLVIWDGHDYCKQIHALLEWFTLESLEDWDIVKAVLRIHFRSADIDDKCNMLRSLSILMRNMVSSSFQARLNLPLLLTSDGQKVETSMSITLIGNLVSELLVECLTWSRVDHNRSLLGETLSFYHAAVNAENEGDLPIMLMIPMTVVYQSLLSNSRLLIERLCSLLLKYDSITKERLYRLGVFQDFQTNFVDFLAVYIMDAYRVLFGGLNFHPELHHGLFTSQYFEKLNQLNPSNELPIEKTFLLSHGMGWAISVSNNIQTMDNKTLAQQYSSTMGIKKFVESKLKL